MNYLTALSRQGDKGGIYKSRINRGSFPYSNSNFVLKVTYTRLSWEKSTTCPDLCMRGNRPLAPDLLWIGEASYSPTAFLAYVGIESR